MTTLMLTFAIFLAVVLAMAMGTGFKRASNLPHQVLALKYMQVFSLPFPVIGAQNHNGFASTSGYFQWFVAANSLFHEVFQIIRKFVYTYGIRKYTILHETPCSDMVEP
jgi:hypothetical protein